MSDINEKLTGLHEMLADELKRQLDGEDDPAPALLNVVRQFLKDNNIDANPQKGSALEGLISQLPDDFKLKNSAKYN